LDPFARPYNHHRPLSIDHVADFARLGPGAPFIVAGYGELAAVQVAEFALYVLGNFGEIPHEQVIEYVYAAGPSVVHRGVGADGLQAMRGYQAGVFPRLASVSAALADEVLTGPIRPAGFVSSLAYHDDQTAVGHHDGLLSVLGVSGAGVGDAVNGVLARGEYLGRFRQGDCGKRRIFASRRRSSRDS